MARLLAFILSSLAIAAATPLTSDTSKQLSARQLPPCAGYGSVCRVDFTNRVNGTSGEFYTEDGDFCTCGSLISMNRPESYVSNPSKFLSNDRPIIKSKQQCSAVFVEDNNQRADVSIQTSAESFLYRLKEYTNSEPRPSKDLSSRCYWRNFRDLYLSGLNIGSEALISVDCSQYISFWTTATYYIKAGGDGDGW